MNNAQLYNKKEFTASDADAIAAAIKEKWDSLKEWPDYRGHDEPSLYPRYLHVSALAGMRDETDADGVVTRVPWVNKGSTYRKAALAATELLPAVNANESAPAI